MSLIFQVSNYAGVGSPLNQYISHLAPLQIHCGFIRQVFHHLIYLKKVMKIEGPFLNRLQVLFVYRHQNFHFSQILVSFLNPSQPNALPNPKFSLRTSIASCSGGQTFNYVAYMIVDFSVCWNQQCLLFSSSRQKRQINFLHILSGLPSSIFLESYGFSESLLLLSSFGASAALV